MQTKQGVYLVLFCLPESCQIYGTWGIFLEHRNQINYIGLWQFFARHWTHSANRGSSPCPRRASQMFDQQRWSHCQAFLKDPTVPSHRPTVWRAVSSSVEPQNGLQRYWMCCGVHSVTTCVTKSAYVRT